MRRTLLLLLVAGATLGAGRSRSPAPDPNRLLFHVETLGGEVIASQGADEPFNPASVVKVATSLFALDRLGPDHCYVTTVSYRGTWDRATGSVDGQLVVEGGGDPDFHDQNAFLVALELNRLGVRRVTGGLAVSGPFTIGWEHGAEGRLEDQGQRALVMAQRVRQALDRGRWNRRQQATWRALAARRGLDPGAPPGVRIQGPAVAVDGAAATTPLVRHLSNPLEFVLKRFNAYSNNDIIRVADPLGGAEGLELYLRHQLAAPAGQVSFETASGERSNRMTARLVVRLMRELERTTCALALAPRDLLPVPGCDDAPVARMFPALATPAYARGLALKTGTLRITDGGVAALAGVFDTAARGLVLFAVAAPNAGRRLLQWREVEQGWLLRLVDGLGGVVPADCGPELSEPDSLARVESLVEQRSEPATAQATAPPAPG